VYNFSVSIFCCHQYEVGNSREKKGYGSYPIS
jgi:hypothetical protein